MTTEKTCARCGKKFGRTVFRSGRVEGITHFNSRVHCSRKCSEDKWRNFVIRGAA